MGGGCWAVKRSKNEMLMMVKSVKGRVWSGGVED
jgi:hypothetical protein